MRRRAFTTALFATAAWPLLAIAQQSVRRVGILDTQDSDNVAGQARHAIFLQGLAQAGWIVGRNLQVDVRWGARQRDRARKGAAELVALAPDVIITIGEGGLGPTLEATRTVPIVFTLVLDPVGSGYIESLARPGGNATGFLQFEYAVAAKWLELLKQIAPHVTRVAVIRETAAAGIGQFGAIQSAATQFGVEVTPLGLRDAAQIERDLAAFARSPNSGLIVTSASGAATLGRTIIALAARLNLPAVYFNRPLAVAGGLISFGSDLNDLYRRAVGYVDRILKGEKPGDLPVQAPTKYELVINLKTAKALGLTIPDALLARADEVIE